LVKIKISVLIFQSYYPANYGTIIASLTDMKNTYFIFVISIILLTSSCYTSRTAGNSGKVPPGQAKKGTPSKSAKPFAPGQRKKY